MWLDAFKSKNGNMQNIGVPGVPGVQLPLPASRNAGFVDMPVRNTAKIQGALGVPLQQAETPGTRRNTATETGGSSDAPPCKASTHKGLPACGTLGTPGTLQKHVSPKISADVPDLVREFMAVDGLMLEDAQALAAVAVQPPVPADWLALIAELDALIDQYFTAVGVSDGGRSRIMVARCAQ